MNPASGWHRPYLQTPYVWHGREPAGWDCWGLIAWCRPRHFGLVAESHAGLYTPEKPAGLAARFDLQEQMITAHLGPWQRVPRRPGAVVLFKIRGRPVHVGLYVGQGSFLHAIAPAGYRPGTPATHLERLDETVWANRVEGFYDRSA